MQHHVLLLYCCYRIGFGVTLAPERDFLLLSWPVCGFIVITCRGNEIATLELLYYLYLVQIKRLHATLTHPQLSG